MRWKSHLCTFKKCSWILFSHKGGQGTCCFLMCWIHVWSLVLFDEEIDFLIWALAYIKACTWAFSLHPLGNMSTLNSQMSLGPPSDGFPRELLSCIQYQFLPWQKLVVEILALSICITYIFSFTLDLVLSNFVTYVNPHLHHFRSRARTILNNCKELNNDVVFGRYILPSLALVSLPNSTRNPTNGEILSKGFSWLSCST